ncbi:hypothetical protein L596_008349 [Steinernema carpocapsae]|uniref:Uncharacterized protein n=1 Tax=Steinernema carpocapsae TaxID=34508 RepID=A0A4U5PDA4_STECR|nr:hypothetical protein L596_008349 [Steinernema carpocapsae]
MLGREQKAKVPLEERIYWLIVLFATLQKVLSGLVLKSCYEGRESPPITNFPPQRRAHDHDNQGVHPVDDFGRLIQDLLPPPRNSQRVFLQLQIFLFFRVLIPDLAMYK